MNQMDISSSIQYVFCNICKCIADFSLIVCEEYMGVRQVN